MMKHYVIAVDSHYDCHEAGLPDDEAYCALFVKAYRRTAREMAARMGVGIEIVEDDYDDPHTEQTRHGDEERIWQDIHDTMTLPEPIMRYACVGPARGWCGHMHLTKRAATACIARDGTGCRSQGGYSDRHAVELNAGSIKCIRDMIQV